MRTKTQKWLECGNGTLKHPISGAPITTDVVELDGFGRIFEVYHYSNEPEQNHRLILAAPMLLEALQDILGLHDDAVFISGDDDAEKVDNTISAIREVIASATGQKGGGE